MSQAWEDAIRSAEELGRKAGERLAEIRRQRREAELANPKHTASAIADALARAVAAEQKLYGLGGEC